MVELWRPVVGFEGFYEVSNLGHVRSLPRIITYPSGRTCRWQGKALAPGRTGDRLTVALCDAEGQTSHYVHELVLTAFVGPCPDGMEGCHNNGNGTDNNVLNLRWDTRSENTFDRVRHGTHHAKNREACPLEHLLVMPNLVQAKWIKRGHRSCLACNITSAAKSQALKKGRTFNFRLEANKKYIQIMGRDFIITRSA